MKQDQDTFLKIIKLSQRLKQDKTVIEVLKGKFEMFSQKINDKENMTEKL